VGREFVVFAGLELQELGTLPWGIIPCPGRWQASGASARSSAILTLPGHQKPVATFANLKEQPSSTQNMPVLRDPKREKFAQLVASGVPTQPAYTQAGYIAPQNAPRLRNHPLVAKRIEELQTRNERKAEAIALKRDELIEILTDVIRSARERLSEARLPDALKAMEMLIKMAGWNEPERVNHGHVHIQVDSGLMEQLRAGYAQLAERRANTSSPPPPLPAGDGVADDTNCHQTPTTDPQQITEAPAIVSATEYGNSTNKK
jgi:hypothetical protein